MAVTITEPSSDEQVIDMYNRGMTRAVSIDLNTATKYAVCLIRLAPAVTPANYPALKAAIEAITGIQEISLLIDHQTRASVPADFRLRAICEFNLRIDPIPE